MISDFFSEKNKITSCSFKKMLLGLGDALSSEKTTSNILSLMDSFLIDGTSFFEDYNKGGLNKTDLECQLTG